MQKVANNSSNKLIKDAPMHITNEYLTTSLDSDK